MVALYSEISRSRMNEGLDHKVAAEFENQADSHMMNLVNLKGGIDLAVDGKFGADIVPHTGELDIEEFGGPEIVEDLLSLAEG